MYSYFCLDTKKNIRPLILWTFRHKKDVTLQQRHVGPAITNVKQCWAPKAIKFILAGKNYGN